MCATMEHGQVPKLATDLRSLCRSQTAMCARVLAQIATDLEQPGSARVAAINTLLDRGWGKAPTTHTGEGGEGPIVVEVVVRERLNQAKVIEHVVPEKGTSD